MKNRIKYLLLILAAIYFVACRHESLSPHEYVKWVRASDNGLNVQKKIDGFEFILQYKPSEYIVLNQHKSDTVSKERIEKELADYSGLQYYTFSVSSENEKDLLKADITIENEYYSRLEYFTSYAQDDISLVENGDTLACVLYHFERNYALSPKVDLVLGFEKTKSFSTSDKQFIFHDRILGIGPIQLTIEVSSINHLPTVDYVKN
jgi:hypothetical protein